ncbi:transcriptional regulator [Marinifilum breve]|uniref:Transcriptional regulator n=1 Tax=Marinifilum breve TaxID=2184082 RepID=A0A2V3ZRW1_9BACT|nr:DUF6377 domain-containing protein [Marinifilum breve]PXX95419.1 transcriptional regulator [Marinifilum breve]
MRRFFILSILIQLLIVHDSSAQRDSLENLFVEAEHYLELRDSIIDARKIRLAIFTDSLKKYEEEKNYNEEYRLANILTKEYESFVYDSAFYYATRSIKLAYKLKSKPKIAEAKSNLSLILLLKGLFKETIDTLETINYKFLEGEDRIRYYSVAYRSYYDLSNSRWGYYQPKYRELGHQYCEKIFQEGDPSSFDYLLAKALSSLISDKNNEAISYYTQLVNEHDLNDHEQAICNCGLGIAYSRFFENEKAQYYLLKATINDIKSATTETVAAKVLAELLYYDGSVERAYQFIEHAQNDANFFGSNARRLEISYIKPDIEAAMLSKVEKQKDFMFYVSIVVLGFAVLIILFGAIVFRQLREIKKARKEALIANKNLQEVNDMLREVSRIKEEYVGYYFNFSSQFIEKLEAFKKAISRQLLTKQYDAIEMELKNYNSKKERQNLFEDFDRIFLKLFPDFVNRFNMLFKDEDKVCLKDSNSLNTDLRIFALIRLGVNDNEKIASILNFSVNTIYTYKTKIKNRSIVPNDEFDNKIMEIKSV